VLFDINRDPWIAGLVRPEAMAMLPAMLPAAPRRYGVAVITSGAADGVVLRDMPAGGTIERVAPLGAAWPRDVFSLSHVALPFPMRDGLYGLEPDPAEDFGIRLGVLAARGERGVLVVHADTWQRLSSNPFFPYVEDRLRGMLDGTP
jgi:hypothetical protein